MSNTVVYAREVSVKARIPIEEVSLNSLALGAIAILATSPAWVHNLITDYTEHPYKGSYGTIMQQLIIRTSAGYSSKTVREVVPAMAATHTISVQKGKENAFITNDYKEVKMQQIAGIQVPINYPNAETKCVITSLVDGALIGINAKKLTGTNFEISPVDAAAIKFPFKALVLEENLPKGLTRAGYAQGTYEAAIKSKDYAEALVNDLPDGVQFDFHTGRYTYQAPAMLNVKDAKSLFFAIMAHRRVRGSDKDARHHITAPYYFGLPTRSLFQNAYVTIDIQALGGALKTKVLEITNTDQLINAHVMSSLVASGWLIRVVGSNQYPERKKNSQGSYIQNKGVFSYFEHDDVFLRWYYVREVAPKVVGGHVTLAKNTPEVVNQLFSIGKAKNAVPFGYVYLNDQMLELKKYYPECSLFPTAHAHNGHVIVVRADVQVPVVAHWDKRDPFKKMKKGKKDKVKVGDVKEKKEEEEIEYKVGPLDYKLYLRRVIEACIWKTYYVFSRVRYFEIDPFAHHVNFFLRNQKEANREEYAQLSFEKEMNAVFDFDRTLSVKIDGAKYLSYIPEVVAKKRQAQAAIVQVKKQLKVEKDEVKILELEREKDTQESILVEAQQEVTLEDRKSKGLSTAEVEDTTGPVEVLELEEADNNLFEKSSGSEEELI